MCVRPGQPIIPPRRGTTYVAGLDIGTRRDLSALVVAHKGQTASGPVVVVDLVRTWRPRRGISGRVDLGEVEAATRRVCHEYSAGLRFDRSQAEQLSQNLAKDSVRVEEFVFSQSGANRLAKALHVALRDHALRLPDDTELLDELRTARIVETGPGLVRMVNAPGTHEDAAVALGMCLVHFLDHPAGLPASLPSSGLAARSLMPWSPTPSCWTSLAAAWPRGSP